MTKDQSPKWSAWQHMPQVSLFEAVSLSLNIDPDSVQLEPGKNVSEVITEQFEAFKDRFRLAERTLTEGGRLRPLTPNWAFQSAVDRQVTLKEFVAWAQSVGWNIPSELVALAKTILVEPDYPKWLKHDLWTVVEAAYLLAGIEPQDVPKIKNDGSPQANHYRGLKDAFLLKGGLTSYPSPTGAIGNTRLVPAECVAWAVSRGLAIPDGLSALTLKGADKELVERERNTLLKMILGMAIKGFEYEPKAKTNKAIALIEAALDGAGLAVGVDTIREKLNEATRRFKDTG